MLYNVLAAGCHPTPNGGGLPPGRQRGRQSSPRPVRVSQHALPWFQSHLARPWIATVPPEQCEAAQTLLLIQRTRGAHGTVAVWRHRKGWAWTGLHAKDAAQLLTSQHMLRLNLESKAIVVFIVLSVNSDMSKTKVTV